MHNLILKALVTLMLLAAVGCQKPEPANEPSPTGIKRSHNTRARVIEIPIKKRDFIAASRNIDQIRKLRLIEVTAAEDVSASPFPEYRLFGIPPQSAYSLLGLEDGDVLVSANDYALNNPEVFKQYVQVLHVESGETFIEIRRNGEELVLNYSFVQ